MTNEEYRAECIHYGLTQSKKSARTMEVEFKAIFEQHNK